MTTKPNTVREVYFISLSAPDNIPPSLDVFSGGCSFGQPNTQRHLCASTQTRNPYAKRQAAAENSRFKKRIPQKQLSPQLRHQDPQSEDYRQTYKNQGPFGLLRNARRNHSKRAARYPRNSRGTR